jgi:hypothetical protein
MTSEPKAFASLSSGLLARKGAARPAMRPQGFGQSGAGLDDLGWNDMGFEPPKPALVPVRDSQHDAFGEQIGEQPLRNPVGGLTPAPSPVHGQQAQIVERFVAPADDYSEEEELDETAELYEPEAAPLQPAPQVVASAAEAEWVAPTVVAAAVEPEPAAPVAIPAPAAIASARSPRRAARPRSAPGTKEKAAFTLRLDPSRHLKLRLACAVSGRSAQLLVTDALDQLLASMPELDAMAAKANRKG